MFQGQGLPNISFSQLMLNEHNKYRKKHGSPDLVLNQSISHECEEFAKSHTDDDTLWNSNGQYGENICLTYGNPISCVKTWYDESKNYNYFRGLYSPHTAHFTQVVWKSSIDFGAGKHRSREGLTFVVARYNPAGNVKGQFKSNVPRPNRSCITYESCTCLTLFCWICITLLGPCFS
ncbi:hypothetical protein ACLKA7_009100 [Drosophila subpalustris]